MKVTFSLTAQSNMADAPPIQYEDEREDFGRMAKRVLVELAASDPKLARRLDQEGFLRESRLRPHRAR